MKDLVILVPTRSRPENLEDLVIACQLMDTKADLVAVCDDDDPKLEDYLVVGVDVILVHPEGKGMARPLNVAARYCLGKYRHFAFLGDDHRPRSKNWDQRIIQALDEIGTGLVYGDDLLQGENLATAVGMTGDIVKALDGMVPPNMIHLYLDNFWMKLGKDLGALRYLPDVIIEHLHPVAGKAQWDDQYRSVNAQDVYDADQKAFIDYIESPAYIELLEKLRK